MFLFAMLNVNTHYTIPVSTKPYTQIFPIPFLGKEKVCFNGQNSKGHYYKLRVILCTKLAFYCNKLLDKPFVAEKCSLKLIKRLTSGFVHDFGTFDNLFISCLI